VVEDAACAIGSTIDGELVGKHSDLVVFSFPPAQGAQRPARAAW